MHYNQVNVPSYQGHVITVPQEMNDLITALHILIFIYDHYLQNNTSH